MVEIEEGRLGALEQDVGPPLEGVVDHADGVGHHGRHPGGQLVEVEIADLVDRQGQAVVHLGQYRVLLLQNNVQLLAEDLLVQEILHAQAHAGGLVGVGRTNAPLGRAEGVLAQIALGDPVKFLVIGHDQMGVARHEQGRRVHALRLESVDLAEQHARIDDHAIADDGRDGGIQDAAGNELESEGLSVNDDAMTGVVAPLIANDDVHFLGQEVRQFALALVAPLGSYYHRCGHWAPPSWPR